MKIAGIIAEYNPFHNGHAHQIDLLRKKGYDYVVALMSGDFVQRGAPAVADKFARTRMALLAGADLVLELPALFAVSSAEYFASAGTALLSTLGCVDTLCFGCEDADLRLLTALADYLNKEPDAYSERLASYLSSGLSFPAARAAALSQVFPDADSFLQKPNNILALEYVRSIRRYALPLTPLPILRTDPGYHDPTPSAPEKGCFLSAEGIRERLFSGNAEAVLPYVPEPVFSILSALARENSLLCADDFSTLLRYRLLSAQDFSAYADCTPALSGKLLRYREKALSFGGLISLLKSRDLTYTRISRTLLHILLGVTKQDMDFYRDAGTAALYGRLLGFRSASATLLSAIKQHAAIPLISKAADAHRILGEDALRLFYMDIYAAKVYNLIRSEKAGRLFPDDYTHPIEIL